MICDFLLWIRRPSLLRRLVLAIVLAIVLAWLAFLSMVVFSSLVPSDGSTMALELRRWSEGFMVVAIEEEDPERIRKRAGQVFSMFNRAYSEMGMPTGSFHPCVQIWTKKHGLVFASPGSAPLPLGSQEAGVRSLVVGKSKWLVGTNFRPDGEAWAVVGLSEVDQYKVFWAFVRGMMPTWLGALALLITVFIFAAKRSLLPLQRLAKSVSERSPYDLSNILSPEPYAETDPLVGEINRLLERAGESVVLQKRFLADAAHELRTPLAALGTQAHVLGQARSVEERNQSIQELEMVLVRTAQVVHQLLTVAHIDDPSCLPDRELIDLDALLQRTAAQAATRYLALGADLSLESEGPLLIRVHAYSITVAVENLLDNALRYGGKGVRVRLSLRLIGGDICIQVQDDGPGVPNRYRENLFKRFYRVPGNQATGSGLGLAIALQVTEIHGGSAKLIKGLSGRGFGVEMNLPIGLVTSG